MKVFIVILNWNQAKLTVECIESLQKLKLGKKIQPKIIIVDNGSSDNSLELFRKIHPKKIGVEILETKSNLGFAGGNNFGIKYSLDHFADYIMVLNNDTTVDPLLLLSLAKVLENPEVGIVSPKIYFSKGYEFHKEKYTKNQLGKVIWFAGGKIDWENVYGKNIGVDEVDRGQYSKGKEIDFATGACFMTRAKLFKEIGLFDEKYFMYLEDADLSLRARHKNYKILFVPKGHIWHKVAQSSGIGSDLNDYFISRNRLLFGFKYASLRTKFALLRESFRLFIFGRHWQAVGIRDFYLRKFGKGSWI